MAVTIKDVAREAGVSTPVVSTVLHGSRGNTRVGEATRKRVGETAARMGYHPSYASRSLALNRSMTLGLYVEPRAGAGLGFDYESSILHGVEEVCRATGYDLLAVNLGGNATHPDICARKFAERRIDGLLLLHVTHDSPWIDALCAEHANVATINYYGPCRKLDILNFDDNAAGELAARHFAECGHRRIGFLESLGEDRGPGSMLRRDGLLGEAARLGLECRPEWRLDRDNPASAASRRDLSAPAKGPLVAAEIIALLRADGPTAWLACNDRVAIIVGNGLRSLGARIPDEVSLMGIDGSPICDYFDPPLTTLHQPLWDMGAAAARMLIERSAPDTASSQHTLRLHQPHIIERASCLRR